MSALIGGVLVGFVLVFIGKAMMKDLQRQDELDELLDEELDDDPADAAAAERFCAKCGEELDDTGACERCLTRLVRRLEGADARLARIPEPDEAEEREVERLQRFLDEPHPEGAFFCPGCLCELD